MRSVLIISHQDESIDRIRKCLPEDCTQFIVHSDQQALELVQNVGANLVVIDAMVLKDEVFRTAERLKGYQTSCIVICAVHSDIFDTQLPDVLDDEENSVDFFVRLPLQIAECKKIIKGALEKQALLQELANLRSRGARGEEQSSPLTPHPSPLTPRLSNPTPLAPYPESRLLPTLAKALSTNFDLDRLLNLFLDIVTNMFTIHRASLATFDEMRGEYLIRAYRGLLPQIASSVRFRVEDALPRWLIKEGRLITRSETESMLDIPIFQHIRSELDMLQAVACIPLLACGNLVGILCIGPRITGIGYTHLELETLFILASHVAPSIQDIGLYESSRQQKAYIENILADMNCGVITIDLNEKVSIYNRRATEILETPSSQVLFQDLRILPSPLGDLLFEALKHGKRHHRIEVQLTRGQIPLEVSSYPIQDANEVVGGVIIIEDLRKKRELEEAHDRSVELDVFNRIMVAMAHEIRNPLMSVQTFIEILPSRYNDEEFRTHFSAIVANDVKRLDGLVEKMIAFTDTDPYQFELGDIEVLLLECTSILEAEYSEAGLSIAVENESAIPVIPYDKVRLSKALVYIIKYLIQSTDSLNQVKITLALLSNQTEKTIRIAIEGEHPVDSTAPLADFLSPFSESQTQTIDLGLWVSQKIIEDHRGRLEAYTYERGALAFLIKIVSE